MKKMIFCLSLIASISLLNAQSIALVSSEGKVTTEKTAAISWDQLIHDFGHIPQGEPATAIFTLTNNSDSPLVIRDVKGSCGCTATYHEDEPVAPGGQTTIKAIYNAKKVGAFNKTLKVTTTVDEEVIVLRIKGSVDNP